MMQNVGMCFTDHLQARIWPLLGIWTRPKELTVPLKANVNFLSLCESMWVCRKVLQSKDTPVLWEDRED